jgi:hypothetical protein
VSGIYSQKRYFALTLLAMEESSLFSQKLYALIARSTLANRDIYDLAYYFRKGTRLDPTVFETLSG